MRAWVSALLLQHSRLPAEEFKALVAERAAFDMTRPWRELPAIGDGILLEQDAESDGKAPL